MPVLSMLERIPTDILEEIALHASLSFLAGPPSALRALLLVSRTLYFCLSRRYNPLLYSRIFLAKFDLDAPRRRLGKHVLNISAQADECIRRFASLRRLKSNTYSRDGSSDDIMRSDLWIAYLMFLENDGKNIRQLIDYTQVHHFALDFVRLNGRLHDGASVRGNWPIDSELNALGLWIFWFTDSVRVGLETNDERLDIVDSLSSICFGSFKYPSVLCPITVYRVPPSTRPPAPSNDRQIFTPNDSPVHPPCLIPKYFGENLFLARPLISSAAILASQIRLGPKLMTAGLDRRDPAVRAEAIRLGWTGVEIEKFAGLEYDSQGMVSITWDNGGSLRHECEWMRLRYCHTPWTRIRPSTRAFTPGQLHGTWEGRWMQVEQGEFNAFLRRAQEGKELPSPLIFNNIIPMPMHFRIREYHQQDRKACLSYDDISVDQVGNGALNGWLPIDTEIDQQGGVKIMDPMDSVEKTYDAFDADQALLREHWPDEEDAPYEGNVWDIILTATPDPDFAEVWGQVRFSGRVRDWDGLVILVREAHPWGSWIFQGYIHNGLNMVGRLRGTSVPVNQQEKLEGIWSVVKNVD